MGENEQHIPATEGEKLDSAYSDELRFSCSSLVRILDQNNRFLLLMNKNRAHQGQRALTPVGGAVQIMPDGYIYLEKVLGVSKEAYEKDNDLRLKIAWNKASGLSEWFMWRVGREISPMRELVEELVHENSILTEEDLQTAVIEFAGYNWELSRSKRKGHEGTLTLRLFEIFDVELAPEAFSKLDSAVGETNAVVSFVSSQEIVAGFTYDQVEVPSVSKALLASYTEVMCFDEV
jgi:hypothetical protein